MYYWTDKVEYKEVEVFGEKILVPANVKYICVDEEGEINGFVNKPEVWAGCDVWVDDMCGSVIYLGQIAMQEHIEDWTVLIEYVGD